MLVLPIHHGSLLKEVRLKQQFSLKITVLNKVMSILDTDDSDDEVHIRQEEPRCVSPREFVTPSWISAHKPVIG